MANSSAIPLADASGFDKRAIPIAAGELKLTRITPAVLRLGKKMLGKKMLGKKMLGKKMLGKKMLGKKMLGKKMCGQKDVWAKK